MTTLKEFADRVAEIARGAEVFNDFAQKLATVCEGVEADPAPEPPGSEPPPRIALDNYIMVDPDGQKYRLILELIEE
jgi:hypothetical protein